MVADIAPGTAGGGPTSFLDVNGTLYFRATDGTNGVELWKTDGTTAGTVMVKDINPGSAGSSPSALVNFNGTLFFGATDAATGLELWKSDGTAAGTVQVKDINPGGISSLANLTVVGSTLFFSANDGAGAGLELWKSDGTAAGTVLVKDINPGAGFGSASSLFNFNGTLLFQASDGSTGSELWKSDGTATGTVQVANINPGSLNSSPTRFTNVNGTVFFTATDGTAAGGTGNELWKTDGTTAGTARVADINPGTANASPTFLTNFNNTLYFAASDGTTGAGRGNELWMSDGTAGGTVRVADINPGTADSFPDGLRVVGSTLFFGASDGTTGNELWKSDGTTAGTVRVADINPGAANSLGTPFLTVSAAVGSTLYFNATNGTTGSATGNELWRSDGTAAGTVQVADIRPGTAGGFPTSFVVAYGTVFFSANNGTNGSELWRLNDGPATTDDAYSTNEDAPLTVSAPGVLGNDTDANSDTLTATKVSDPANGSVTLNANGSFTYTPNANFNGSDSFTYKANDGSLDSNPVATVNITVTSVDDTPVAVDDSYSTPKDAPLTVSAPGVLGNDTDGDANPLTAGSASTPANGSVILNADGSFTYTPNTGFVGSDSFTYKANDGTVDSNAATVTIAVTVPTVSASPGTVTAGDPVTATWSGIAAPSATDWVGLYDSSSALDPALLAWSYTDGTAAGSLNLTVPLGSPPGATYELRLYSNNTYTRLATSAPFTVVASATTIAASPSTVDAGSPVTATWSGIAAPTATDWVGLYDSAATPDAGLLAWAYTGGAAAGNLNLTVPAGSTPGATYELRLFTNNTYGRLATSAPFTVVASATTVSASPASVNAGDPVTATWSAIASPTATDWVGLYDSSSAADPALLAWSFTDGNAAGTLNLTVPVGAASGATYELRLFSANTYTRLATSGSFTVVASAATISASPPSVVNGGPVTATWSGIGSPSATDWVGLYASSGDPDPAIVAWAYTGGAAAGSLNLTVPVGSPPGATYELRLFHNNTYTRLATSAPFSVT
jgi:ELWxxDGT repeat protein/VCBS repeat-containing protein